MFNRVKQKELFMKNITILYLIPVCIFGFEKLEEEKTIRPLFQFNEKMTFGESSSMETEAIEDWDGNKSANINLKMSREMDNGFTFESIGSGKFNKDFKGNDTGEVSLKISGTWDF